MSHHDLITLLSVVTPEFRGENLNNRFLSGPCVKTDPQQTAPLLRRHLLKRLRPLLRMFAEVYDLRRHLLQRRGLLLPTFTEVYAKCDVVDPMNHHSTN